MASALDINCVYEGWVDVGNIELRNLMNQKGIFLDNIQCMDNWTWDNLRTIEIEDIWNELYNNRIIIMKFKSQNFFDVGCYLEKYEENNVCGFWINTKSYPELDENVINHDNEKYYQFIFQAIQRIKSIFSIQLKLVGIGVEMIFEYDKDIEKIIRNSHGAAAWLIQESQQKQISIDGFGGEKSVIPSMRLLKKVQ